MLLLSNALILLKDIWYKYYKVISDAGYYSGVSRRMFNCKARFILHFQLAHWYYINQTLLYR